jgi:hypothetical protein
LPVAPAVIVAPQERTVTEGQDAVFTLTRRGGPGPCQRVRVRVSGHDKIMGRLTARLDEFDVVFPPGTMTRTLRLSTQQDNRNEGDGEVRVTLVGSSGHPRTAAVRVRDDDVPEVTLHAVFPAGLALQGGTWVGDILEGNKVRFETRCSGGYQYSHPRSILPLVDHAHEFRHPVHSSYDVSGFAFAPCNREHEFGVRADQSHTGPAGGEIRAALLSGSDLANRWVDGRIQHDNGRLYAYIACAESDFSFCPRYTVGTPNALRLAVRNANPTVTVAAQRAQVGEGEPARFVITRHWDHPALFDNAQPGDPAVKTRIGYRVMGAAEYVAGQYTGDKERDAFNLTVHQYTVEVPTVDDAMRRADGSVTLELLPDTFAAVNVGGTYELYETIPGITPPGLSSIRATVTIRDNEVDPIVSISDTGGPGNAGTAGFTVSLTGPSEMEITVDWHIRAGGAPPGDEHDDHLAGGMITFPPGETAQTVSVPIAGLTLQPAPNVAVTLSNPVNAVFPGGASTIEAMLLVPVVSFGEMPGAPAVAAVPDTAGNLLVSWQAPHAPPPASYEVQYRRRGTPEWAAVTTDGETTHVPLLFLDQDTEYEARVRAHYEAAQEGGNDAAVTSEWSDSGFGRTGVHQPGSKPVVTVALVDAEPVVEGEPVLLHVVVSELRNSYSWQGLSAGISVDLEYGWRRGGNTLPASSRFGVVPGVFTVDHELGGFRHFRIWLPEYAAEHGPLTVMVQPGDDYRVGEAASVCVSIADRETRDATRCPDADESSTSAMQAGAPVSIAVRDARATEGVDEIISFNVALSAAAAETVTVHWATADGTATAGQDYEASSGTLTFTEGQTDRAIAVTVIDDAHDEGEETFTLLLSGAVGAELADAKATGTIANSDPMPRAWLGRFGRTAWEHALGAVDERLRSAGSARTHAKIGGYRVATAPSMAASSDEQRMAAHPYAVSGSALLAGSEFEVAALTSAPEVSSGRGAAVTVWGRGAYGGFAGADAGLSVRGRVASGTLGVDYAAGPWLAGLALSHSAGRGSYSQPGVAAGEVTSSLSGAYPYLGVDILPDRLTLWLAGGYGIGGLRLAPPGGQQLETSIGLLAGAGGLRGTLLTAPASGGFALGMNADASMLRATSTATAGLAAAAVDVNRLRLGLEGSYAAAVGGALLTPSFELAMRRDGGGAETGYGLEVGGGLSYTHRELGLAAGLRAGALLLHEAPRVTEWGASGWLSWDPHPASALGPSLTVSPSIGVPAVGDAATLWRRDTLAGWDGRRPVLAATGRVDAKVGYGLPLAGGTGTPWAGIGLAEGERSYRLGYEFQVGPPAAVDVRIALHGERRERDTGVEPEHTLALHSTVQW